MALFDVTHALELGERLLFEDDCVYVLRSQGGNVTVKIDSGVTREAAGQLLSKLGEALCGAQNTNSVPEPTADSPQPDFESVGVDPEKLTEDLVRWADGFTAYKLPGDGWWWVKWNADTGERWGLSGPLMGAVATKKGPFDNFDETLASLLLFRSLGPAGGEILT